jgi:hypothetical protein
MQVFELGGRRGLVVKAAGWLSLDRQFEPYPRANTVAPSWCGLGCRSRTLMVEYISPWFFRVGNDAKRMRFQIKGLDNVKLSEHARFCIESLKVLFLYDVNNDMKSLGQTIIRMSNLSSINCFDTHGNGQTDPVIFTGQTQTSQQRVGTATTNRIYQNYELSQFFYNPYPEILYNFIISSNVLNNILILLL